MKRVLLIIVALMLLGFVSFAESKPVLFDNAGIKITAEGAELCKDYVHGGQYLKLNVIIENTTDAEVRITSDNCEIDDWDIESNCYIEIQPKKKKKDEIDVYFQQSDITSFKKVNAVRINFKLMFNSDYSSIQTYEGKNVKGKWINRKIGKGETKNSSSDQEGSLDYDAISRNPNAYQGQDFTFTGEVIQALEGTESLGSVEVDMRVATKGSFDNVVYVVYYRNMDDPRVLEGDSITINASYYGLHTYEALLGNQVTIPLFIANSVAINH